MTGKLNSRFRSNALSGALAALLSAGLSPGVSSAASPGLCMVGVNLSSAEYGDPGGAYGTAYIYPSEKTVTYFARKGMDTVRLPFRWERLQPVLNAPLDTVELDRLKQTVALLRQNQMTVILDPHNTAYFAGHQLGSAEAPAFAFADFWTRLAAEFANQDGIVFGLMNEPYDLQADQWLAMANPAIVGIRAVGAQNLVLVPGTRWTGAHSWFADAPGGSNADEMIKVSDPANNFAFEFHQYLDDDFSGTHDTCPKSAAAIEAIEKVGDWLAQDGHRGFIGEFGASKDPACLKGLSAMANAVAKRPDVWLGWTYWAGGDWWPESEANNIQPAKSGDRPQLAAILQQHKGRTEATGQCASPAQ